jgi:hypothetical protein
VVPHLWVLTEELSGDILQLIAANACTACIWQVAGTPLRSCGAPWRPLNRTR